MPTGQEDVRARLNALADNDLFRGLPEVVLASIAWASEPVRFAPGEVLMRRGAPSDAMLLVLEGLAAVTMERPWRPGRRAMSWVKPGECLGEIGVLIGQPRSATVTAASPLSALHIPGARLLDILNNLPQAGSQIARVLARRLARLARREMAQRRQADLIVLLLAEGEDGAPLVDALLAQAEGEARRLSGEALRGATLPGADAFETVERMIAAMGALDALLGECDFLVATQPAEAPLVFTQPLVERADLALRSPGATRLLSRAQLRALAGERHLPVLDVQLVPAEAPRVAARLGRPHEVAVFIPTTIDVDQAIDPTPHVEAATALLGERFGGATVEEASGVWKSEALGLVGERIIMVSAACGQDAFNRHLDAVTTFMVELKATLRQEAMAMRLDGRLVLL
ncbi:MAG: cyclic nucleotide-binding domain-containing protein [Alphaproteobacteria bacterium]|nr:cyclic nucleotide-binding domain-containing protein [Alphaproteobacteria bacterium]MCB9795383.1 cyclic nucleotide-binding domain-containing protein [Alphaproteobacteria bacterium]